MYSIFDETIGEFNSYRFRFDDVCLNTNMSLIRSMSDFLVSKFPGCEIIFGVSPLCHDNCGQRVFPLDLMPLSDHRTFYSVNKCGIPNDIPNYVKISSHGLIHVDHRLLSKEAQELSILVAASLTESSIFTPPFNHYDHNSILICDQAGIELIKYEDGWKNLKYKKFNLDDKPLWYLHSYEFSIEHFISLFD